MSHQEDQDAKWLTTKEKILIPFVIFLLATLWKIWLHSALYDEYLKHIPIDALWIIVLLLLTAILVLIVTVRQKNRTLKNQASLIYDNFDENIERLEKLLKKKPNIIPNTPIVKNLTSKFGVFWDKDKNAYCPTCQKHLSYSPNVNHTDFTFRCDYCKAFRFLVSETGNKLTIVEAKKLL